MTNLTCPLCQAQETKKVVTTSSWKIIACLACTNAWTEPAPDEINYAQENFHQANIAVSQPTDRKSLTDLPLQWRKSLLMQADLLTHVLEPKAKILEIGCGEGLLLEELVRRDFQVTGIEPSVEASQVARQTGLNVVTGYFPHPDVQGLFDAVVMTQVLEHLPRPLEIFRKIHQVAPGGNMLLVQTNWQGLMPRILGRRWYAWVPRQHFWHFTPKGLAAILQPLRWKIKKVEYSSLVHNHIFYVLSNMAASIPGLGDQFHLLAEIPEQIS